LHLLLWLLHLTTIILALYQGSKFIFNLILTPDKSNIFQWPNIYFYQNLVHKKIWLQIVLVHSLLYSAKYHSPWSCYLLLLGMKKGKIISIPSGMKGKKNIQSVLLIDSEALGKNTYFHIFLSQPLIWDRTILITQ
jgi:hypothetical protein